LNNTNTVLSVQNVTKKFLGTTALCNVSLKLYQNEILAVMGENGAGKSTLMKILSGSYPCTEYEGNIFLNEQTCRFNCPTDSENMGIAMIYQELNLELDLTVAENIMLGRLPLKKHGLIDWEQTKTIARSALDKLHADIDVNVTVRSLSPSMQQLVCIARALVRNPRILILDEPTSVLTETETQKLMNVLCELREQGISCIYISHKLDEVFEISDRMVILRDGQYISEYRKCDGYDSTKVIEDMIGRRLDVMYPGEILGLAGLVGSGRSELINALFGIIPKTNGKVFLEGKEITINSPQDAKKYGIGLMTEDRKKNGFVGTMSICHNMTLTILKELKGLLLIDSKKERKRAKEYFDTLRVKAPSLDTRITSLSGGNQQKVILSKWLMTDLKVILLDEPTRGIDVGTKSEIYKLMLDLSAKGICIIMISSEMPELVAMCDRFVVLGKGKVQKIMSKEEANEINLLKAASNT